MLLSSGDNFPHLIKKRRSQLGFVTYLLNYPRIYRINQLFFPTETSYALCQLLTEHIEVKRNIGDRLDCDESLRDRSYHNTNNQLDATITVY